MCKLSERCLREPLKLIRFSFFGLPKLLLCSVCCKPFCFCSLPKLHSRLEGLKDDRRNHRTFDSRVTIPNPRKKKGAASIRKLCFASGVQTPCFTLFFSPCLVSFLSLIILSVDVALSNALFVLLAVWCVGVSCGHWVLFLRSFFSCFSVPFKFYLHLDAVFYCCLLYVSCASLFSSSSCLSLTLSLLCVDHWFVVLVLVCCNWIVSRKDLGLACVSPPIGQGHCVSARRTQKGLF